MPANFAGLDDLTFVVTHFLPHLNRDSVWRILRAEGLSRRPKPASGRPAKGQDTFKDHDLGFVHIDIKHLPKPQNSDGVVRNRVTREAGLTLLRRMIAPSCFQRWCRNGSRDWCSSEAAQK